MLSCSDNDEGYNIGNSKPRPLGEMGDAGNINRIRVYCVDGNTAIYQSDADFVFDSYSQVRFYIVPRTSSQHSTSLNVVNAMIDYYVTRSSFIIEEYNNLLDKGEYGYPCFYSAYINGEVTLTCDKTLFGKEPGVNLSPHFKAWVASTCMPVGRNDDAYLLYGFDDEMPISMDDVFVMDAWMFAEYCITFLDTPEERYDELTFQFTFPLSREHVEVTMLARENGINTEMLVTDDVYATECTVRLKPL